MACFHMCVLILSLFSKHRQYQRSAIFGRVVDTYQNELRMYIYMQYERITLTARLFQLTVIVCKHFIVFGNVLAMEKWCFKSLSMDTLTMMGYSDT